ncbi:MAG: YchJ family metal-binding protein [Sulfuriferula sp.]
MAKPVACPCGTGLMLDGCCALYLHGKVATTPEQLMRSRYSAYVLKDECYLLATWHASTCPASLNLADDDTRWLGLKVLKHQYLDTHHAVVAFVARYKVAGKAYQLHETSQFMLENGRWFYVDGVLE